MPISNYSKYSLHFFFGIKSAVALVADAHLSQNGSQWSSEFISAPGASGLGRQIQRGDSRKTSTDLGGQKNTTKLSINYYLIIIHFCYSSLLFISGSSRDTGSTLRQALGKVLSFVTQGIDLIIVQKFNVGSFCPKGTSTMANQPIFPKPHTNCARLAFLRLLCP